MGMLVPGLACLLQGLSSLESGKHVTMSCSHNFGTRTTPNRIFSSTNRGLSVLLRATVNDKRGGTLAEVADNALFCWW
jgi:hypothetical protein